MTVSRRGVIKGFALTAFAGAGKLLAESSAVLEPKQYPQTAPASGDVIRVSDSNPVVETQHGKIRGYTRNGIFAFKAIPYGADTAGPNRFLPPQKPVAWAGIRSCLYHGYVSPQAARGGWKNNEESWLFSWDDGTQSEDCLNLNVWTPALNTGKRPVMVWLHGGGFTAGSSTELPSYDGENLAHSGDVVVVSVNHRLNVFGFLNLSSLGDRFANSGNVGMLDIVAALEWVRDNIERFGGDPANVTIFGQSGGGGKVSTLMGMPSAKGLFHRAIVESGSMGTSATMESSNELAQKLSTQLGMNTIDAQKLQEMPFDQLVAAAVKTTTPVLPASGVLGLHRRVALGWQPVAGNSSLPVPAFSAKAPEESADVPLLVGTTLNEFITAINKPDAFKMTGEELHKNVSSGFEIDAAPILEVFKAEFPGANNFQLWSIIGTSPFRGMALRQAKLKRDQNKAPAYCYRFDWQSPVLDGRPMAFHCSEIAFAFDNVARCENMTGNGPAARALAEKVSQAWIHFARTGNPNHDGIPHWDAFAPENGGAMIFDNECVCRQHVDDAMQKAIAPAMAS